MGKRVDSIEHENSSLQLDEPNDNITMLRKLLSESHGQSLDDIPTSSLPSAIDPFPRGSIDSPADTTRLGLTIAPGICSR